jgi:type VI secretion system protein ImpA
MTTEFDAELASLSQSIEGSGAFEPGDSGKGPCGDPPDATPELATLESLRIFGLLTPPAAQTDWQNVRSRSLALLGRSRDFRVLAHYTAALLRTGTLGEALRVFPLLQTWLEQYWNEVHPRLDEDAIARRNALNCFADRVAILDALRRLPLLSHPQLGVFSLRDIDIAMGVQPNPDPDRESRTETEVQSAIETADIGELRAVSDNASRAEKALTSAQDIMRQKCGADDVPDLEPLIKQLSRIQQVLFPRISAQTANDAVATSSDGDAGETTQAQSATAGSIRSRQDATRALEAVANYFRRHEPGSPVPLLVERAKRMISMDFLELLADLAPEALEQAKRATGVSRAD